jgi:hypothetical protein
VSSCDFEVTPRFSDLEASAREHHIVDAWTEHVVLLTRDVRGESKRFTVPRLDREAAVDESDAVAHVVARWIVLELGSSPPRSTPQRPPPSAGTPAKVQGDPPGS